MSWYGLQEEPTGDLVAGTLIPVEEQQAAAARARQRRAEARSRMRLITAKANYVPPVTAQPQFGHPGCFTVLDKRGLILGTNIPNEAIADAIVEFLNT
jgi:hypothetical protein